AEELRRYVQKMSGAELRLVATPSGKPAILLVNRPRSRSQSVNDAREFDSYRLNISSKRLEIEGASPRAVLYGVYDLLERLGCSWCVPGDDSVPKQATLELAPQQVEAQPVFQYRMMLDFPLLSVAQSIAISDWIAKH